MRALGCLASPRLASLRCASLGAARAALGSAATVHRTNASMRLRRSPASLARFPARRQAGAPRRGLGGLRVGFDGEFEHGSRVVEGQVQNRTRPAGSAWGSRRPAYRPSA
jgi:hypothetical protein